MSETTITDQQIIADLQAARSELVKRGRALGYRVRHDGSVCALGAIAVAVVPGFDVLYLSRALTPSGTPTWARHATLNPRIKAAERALSQHLPEEVASIDIFNDRHATTDADVLNLFSKALAELGGLA